MSTRLDSKPIRVDDEVYSRILAKKTEMEQTERRVVSLNDALRKLLKMNGWEVVHIVDIPTEGF